MKYVKKFAMLLLAMVMMMSVSVTAFAAQQGSLTGGSITINDALEDQNYSIYQILYLESYNAAAGAYAYKANTAWSSFLSGDDIKGVYVNIDGQGYVTWVEGASASAFAKSAQAYAKANNIPADAARTAAAPTAGADYSTVTFSSLKLGYYLVDTTLGTLCSLDTTNPSATIEEKNETPANEKEVKEGSVWGESNDANIGDTVEFRSTVTLPVGSENVVFHDDMSAGLTLDTDSIKVYTNAELSSELNTASYTVAAANLSDNCDFEVSFTSTYLDSLKTTTTVYVAYSAVLNENAVVGSTGNANDSWLKYGDTTNQKETPKDTTRTYTWDVDIFKYTMDGTDEKALSGARFTLSRNNNDDAPIKLIVTNTANTYRVAKSDETSAVTEITTDTTGKFTIEGLDSGTYYLTETASPTGYNRLSDPITIVIADNGNVTVGSGTPVVSEVRVLNQSGNKLPSTGGMGTTIFYVAGSILLLGAGVLLVTKRRMNRTIHEEN